MWRWQTSYSQNDFKKYICTQKSNRWAGWVAFVLSFIDLSVKVDRDSNRMNSLIVWTGKILWLIGCTSDPAGLPKSSFSVNNITEKSRPFLDF